MELTTKRLLLRPFTLEDADDVFAYSTDAEWARYLPGLPQPYLYRHAEEFVARAVLASWETNPRLAIEFESKVVGGINARIREKNNNAEIGYGIARPHWSRGLVTEAASAFIGWLFDRYGLAKVYAIADPRNTASWRVMEKLGMTREGVMRGNFKGEGERIDEVYYGLLREEWVNRSRG